MNRHETNKTNMCGDVLANFDENSQILTKYPFFSEPVGRLRLTVTEINETDKEFIAATGGKTTSKANAEDILLEKLLPVKSALFVIGNKQNNEELKALCSDSEPELKRMRDSLFCKKAESILKEAGKYKTELLPLTITEVVLTELNQSIADFKAGIDGQSTGFDSRSALRKKLDSLFVAADKIITDELDQLIELIRKEEKLFYDKYQIARGIKNLGGSKKRNDDDTDSTNPPTSPEQ